MDDLKYIKTKEGYIIVFPGTFSHSDFKKFEPISAGFVSVGVNSDKEISCKCYGESIGLKLKPAEEDKFLIEMQIFNNFD